jgi:hypothetical protein
MRDAIDGHIAILNAKHRAPSAWLANEYMTPG